MPGCRFMPSPDDTVRHARSGRSVVGWKLDPAERGALLERFAPRYDKVVADHVTLAAKVAADTPLPEPVDAEAVGHVDDGRGVEALVIAVGGSSERPDGSIYHVTWSLAPGRQARESNDVLAKGSWQPFRDTIPLTLVPARWP